MRRRQQVSRIVLKERQRVANFTSRRRRGLSLLLAIALVAIGFLALEGWMPFMAMYGSSMAPELKPGDLIFISPLSPSEIKEGDIIVYSLPEITRQTYGYPQIVAHRVVRIDTTALEPRFRTRGDNTAGEDPFMVRSQDVKGRISRQIPYLGFPILYLQSREGKIFLIIALVIFALSLYSLQIYRAVNRSHRKFFEPVLEQNQELAKRQEKSWGLTRYSIEQFSTAMSNYATHLQSHTEAVKGMAEASQELKKTTEALTRILTPEEEKRWATGLEAEDWRLDNGISA